MLAAGRSTRMGGPNKLVAEIGGKPLVRIAAEQALASRAKPVIVVTGHQRERVEAALAGLPVRLVHNPDFAQGLGTSVRAGIAAVPASEDGAVILPRRHAAGRCRADQPIDRRLRARAGRAGGGPDHRGQARQSGAVVAPVLSRPDGGSRAMSGRAT